MGYLNYAIVSLISFLGLFVGMVLAFVSPEEMKPGEKYFKIIKGLAFIVMAVIIVYLTWYHNILFFITIIVFLVFYLKFLDSHWFYLALGIYMGLGFRMEKFFIVVACLVFICGLPTGSLFVYKSKSKKKFDIVKDALLKHTLPYAIPALLLPFLFSYL